jgi:hypothetical protein
MEMQYLQAEHVLGDAEASAWGARDWDSLSRLYLPLQEARRQRRQRCGEGTVWLDLIARSPSDILDPEQIVEQAPHGQLLIAGWETAAPAATARQLAEQRGLYLDVFLAAATAENRCVVLPRLDTPLADGLPLPLETLPRGQHAGTFETYGFTMDLWERLHTPLLAAADAVPDPIARMQAYRGVIEVDYACELAHQKLADTARGLLRGERWPS